MPSGHLLSNLALFGRLLRAAGIPVQPAQIADLVLALTLIDLGRREDVKNAARTILVSRREHLSLFDHAFDLFWQAHEQRDWPGRRPGQHPWRGLENLQRPAPGLALPLGLATDADSDLEPEPVYTYSAIEILRHKPFAQLTPTELLAMKRLILAMPWRPILRRTRRTMPAPHGIFADWRRTMRHNLRYGGEMLKLARRSRKLRPRPLVVLCDISGSMQRYSRLLLQFVFALGQGQSQVEAFVFSTRLTRITPHLRRRPLGDALAAVSQRASDLGGGTQIGQALRVFNYVWGRRVLGRGATVLLISDGWDRGDPALISREMARLQLSARRLIWLNPLLGSPQYEPLTRGMQAALPYIDDFLPVHNLHSLEQLADVLLKASPDARPLSHH